MLKMNITYGCIFTKLDLNDHYMVPSQDVCMVTVICMSRSHEIIMNIKIYLVSPYIWAI